MVFPLHSATTSVLMAPQTVCFIRLDTTERYLKNIKWINMCPEVFVLYTPPEVSNPFMVMLHVRRLHVGLDVCHKELQSSELETVKSTVSRHRIVVFTLEKDIHSKSVLSALVNSSSVVLCYSYVLLEVLKIWIMFMMQKRR